MTDRPFFRAPDKEENAEEEFEACFHQPGKKRRLASEQVQFLERNFEVENKLEAERKVQLAKELGLQPRQVAIWFQNRRARFKTKQLEKDYATLKASYDKLKGDYDNLLRQNDKLKQEVPHSLLSFSVSVLASLKKSNPEPTNGLMMKTAQVNSLKTTLMSREKEKGGNFGETHDVLISNDGGSENGSKVEQLRMVICKQEDANSAKSDVFDSDSPHHTAGSSHAFEAEHSDFSQDEEENLSQNLLSLPCLPKVEEHCSFGFPEEDQTFCFWPYWVDL